MKLYAIKLRKWKSYYVIHIFWATDYDAAWNFMAERHDLLNENVHVEEVVAPIRSTHKSVIIVA